jgi:hypothetical protein
MIGNFTAANKKGQLNCLSLKESVKCLSPQQGMCCPAGPERAGPRAGEDDEYGKIE